MTLASTVSVIRIPGTGAQTAFNYNFRIPFQQDGVTPAVAVWYQDANNALTKLMSSQYSITGVGSPTGGVVTYNPSGTPIPNGTFLIIMRDMLATQESAFSNQSFYPSSVETGLDWLTMLAQQMLETEGRTLRGAPGEIIAKMPAAALRANNALGFDVDGNPIAIAPGGGSIATLPWANITGKPGTFPATPTDHTLITDFNAAVDAEINSHLVAGTNVTLVPSGGHLIVNSTGGGGAVGSVQGHTGTVVLKSGEIGGIVSIKDYGALCDGNPTTEAGTDDTAAWTAAITDINAGTIHAIHVPGYSFVSGALPTITNRVAIIGEGPSVSGIIQTSGADVTLLNFDTTGCGSINEGHNRRYLISGLFIGTKATNSGQAAKFHSYTANFGNIMKDLIVSGWPNHRTSAITGLRYGFNRGMELVNTASSYFVNTFIMGFKDTAGTFPTNNLITLWGWNCYADAGGGAFNNRWVNCDVGACNIGFYGPSGNLQGWFFYACNPGTCGYAFKFSPSLTSNPPCFEFSECQTECFYDAISITNASYINVTNCCFIQDNNLVFDRAAVRLTNVVQAIVNNNFLVASGVGSGTDSFLIATDCPGVVSNFNTINGLSGYGVRFTGTTQNSVTHDDTVMNPAVSATPFANDGANNTTNRRRRWNIFGATAAQGQMPQIASNAGAITLGVGVTILASIPAIGVVIGDRIQVQIAASFAAGGTTNTFVQCIVKETNYPGVTVTRWANTQKNFSRYARFDSTMGRQDFFETLEFDIFTSEPAAIMSLTGLSGSGDATSTVNEITVRRL